MSETNPKLPLVVMRAITKRFPGVLANDRVNLELYPGEVLALLGENGAGKSTLMNILSGLYRPDEGQIFIRGQEVAIHSPRDAARLGIGMVYQHFMLVPTMTVAENIILGLTSEPFITDMKKVETQILALSEAYNLHVDPKAYIWQLGVGEQQRVEILKLLYRGAEVLILDEPTAVLTPQEADELAEMLRRMTAEGKAAVFITHKMEEVMNFSQRVMVLRQGQMVATLPTAQTNPQELARLMVGREVLFRLDKTPFRPGAPVLEVRSLSALNDKGLSALNDVSLCVHEGEILGIAGVAGNGQKELAEVVAGLRKPAAGQVLIRGEEVTRLSPLARIQRGLSHIPGDRTAMGVAGNMAVAENLAMKNYRSAPISRRGLLDPRRILDFARRMIDAFRIATPTPQTQVKFLSGGNLQKVILAREVDACGGVMLAVDPTRGLDVGATEYIRKLLLEQRDRGTAVLLISEDLEELLSVADNIAVLFEGRIMGVVPAAEADIEHLGLMMAGQAMPERGS